MEKRIFTVHLQEQLAEKINYIGFDIPITHSLPNMYGKNLRHNQNLKNYCKRLKISYKLYG